MGLKTDEDGKVSLVVTWCAEDVLDAMARYPEWKDATIEDAQEWLEDNAKYIENDMVDRGWDSIHILLP